METITINILCPNPDDATAYYRAYGALRMVKNHTKYNIIITDYAQVNWRIASMCDVILMLSPHTETHIRIAQIARAMGCRVWIDYDDLIWNLPAWFKTAHYYLNCGEVVARLCMMAHLITVSTQRLHDALIVNNAEYNVLSNAYTKIIVRENFYCNYIPEIRSEQKTDDNRMHIVWRGSYSHNADVGHFINAIWDAIDTYSVSEDPKLEVILHVIGDPSHEFFNKPNNGNKINRVPPLELDAYMQYIHDLPFGIGIIPLTGDHFNLCKSDIAYQEFLHAGMLSVNPFYDDTEGYYTIGDTIEFRVALLTLMLNTSHRRIWDNEYTKMRLANEINKRKLIELINKIRK